MICVSDQYACESSSMCIFEHWVCDNEADCPQGDDELNCSNHNETEFKIQARL